MKKTESIKRAEIIIDIVNWLNKYYNKSGCKGFVVNQHKMNPIPVYKVNKDI